MAKHCQFADRIIKDFLTLKHEDQVEALEHLVLEAMDWYEQSSRGDFWNGIYDAIQVQKKKKG